MRTSVAFFFGLVFLSSCDATINKNDFQTSPKTTTHHLSYDETCDSSFITITTELPTNSSDHLKDSVEVIKIATVKQPQELIKEKLVGTWKLSDFQGTITFNSNNQYAIKITDYETYPENCTNYKGTWSVVEHSQIQLLTIPDSNASCFLLGIDKLIFRDNGKNRTSSLMDESGYPICFITYK